MVALRLLFYLAVLVVPGGLFLLLYVGMMRRKRATPTLDFDGKIRRVPDTRRGRHSPILVTGI